MLASGIAYATEKEFIITVTVDPMGADIVVHRNNLIKKQQERIEDHFWLEIKTGCTYVKGYAARWPSGAVKESGDILVCDDEQHYTVNLRLPYAEQKDEDKAYEMTKRMSEKAKETTKKLSAKMPKIILEERMKQRERRLNNAPITTKCVPLLTGGFECTSR